MVVHANTDAPPLADHASGVSIRFVRDYDIEAVVRVDRVEAYMVEGLSRILCVRLGHTFRFNVGEPRCNICGVANPAVVAPADAHLGAVDA